MDAMQGIGGGFLGTLSKELNGRVWEFIIQTIGKTYMLVIVAGVLVVVLSSRIKMERPFISVVVAAA